jgi:hypothetical protein
MCKGFVASCVRASLVVALAGAACSKSTGPATPSGPSSAAAQPAASASGATIAGAIMSAAGSSSVHAMGAPITVSVVGTGISVTIDPSGNFTLQNVPPGDVTLSFMGNGVAARLTLTGVSDRETIDIVVNLHGTTADADETEREKADHRAEVEGRISSITPSTRTVVVGRRQAMLVIPTGVPIHHGSTIIDFSQLVVGERIHAHATKNGATFTATDVELQNENADVPNPGDDHGHNGNDANEAEVKGTVSGAAAGHACPAFTFSVGSTTVTTTASTKFEDTTCAGVVNGVSVEVKGTRASATAITATRVEKQ